MRIEACVCLLEIQEQFQKSTLNVFCGIFFLLPYLCCHWIEVLSKALYTTEYDSTKNAVEWNIGLEVPQDAMSTRKALSCLSTWFVTYSPLLFLLSTFGFLAYFCFFLLSPSAYSTPINYYTSRGERRVGGRKQKKIYWRRGREESGRSGSILYSQKNTTSYGYIYRAIALLGGVIKIYDLRLIIFRLYTYMYVFPIFLSHNAVQANVHYIATG